MPNFGKDHDIIRSEDSAVDAEKALGHVFTPKWNDEDDKFEVPTESIEFKLAATGQDVRMEKKDPDDPECKARTKSSIVTDDQWK